MLPLNLTRQYLLVDLFRSVWISVSGRVSVVCPVFVQHKQEGKSLSSQRQLPQRLEPNRPAIPVHSVGVVVGGGDTELIKDLAFLRNYNVFSQEQSRYRVLLLIRWCFFSCPTHKHAKTLVHPFFNHILF